MSCQEWPQSIDEYINRLESVYYYYIMVACDVDSLFACLSVRAEDKLLSYLFSR